LGGIWVHTIGWGKFWGTTGRGKADNKQGPLEGELFGAPTKNLRRGGLGDLENPQFWGHPPNMGGVDTRGLNFHLFVGRANPVILPFGGGLPPPYKGGV